MYYFPYVEEFIYGIAALKLIPVDRKLVVFVVNYKTYLRKFKTKPFLLTKF
jgi:hypothetical protein